MPAIMSEVATGYLMKYSEMPAFMSLHFLFSLVQRARPGLCGFVLPGIRHNGARLDPVVSGFDHPFARRKSVSNESAPVIGSADRNRLHARLVRVVHDEDEQSVGTML